MNPDQEALRRRDSDRRTLAEALHDADVFRRPVGGQTSWTRERWCARMAPADRVRSGQPRFPRSAGTSRSRRARRRDHGHGPLRLRPTKSTTCSASPSIFRGALDVRATAINEEMKMAAVNALRVAHAREGVPDSVRRRSMAAENLAFGPSYIIPKPFDPRVLPSPSPTPWLQGSRRFRSGQNADRSTSTPTATSSPSEARLLARGRLHARSCTRRNAIRGKVVFSGRDEHEKILRAAQGSGGRGHRPARSLLGARAVSCRSAAEELAPQRARHGDIVDPNRATSPRGVRATELYTVAGAARVSPSAMPAIGC